ncbi:MAG TPA: hypothetical protein VIK86_00370 [Candidatus Paceibacterota bacterium]
MDKKTLNNLELQVTQKIQLHFPRGVISKETLTKWDNCSNDMLSDLLFGFFKSFPDVNMVDSIIRVDRYIVPILPHGAEEFIHSDLEYLGIDEYEVNDFSTYTYEGNSKDIYLSMIDDETNNIKDHLGYYDLLAIKSKGINFFRTNFIGRIYGLKGAVAVNNDIYLPFLECGINDLFIKWHSCWNSFSGFDYLASFSKNKTK